MRNIWKYMRKFMKNEGKVYNDEQQAMAEVSWFLIVAAISVVAVATPLGRNILKWLAYVFTGGSAVFFTLMIVTNLSYLFKRIKRFAKMEEAGVSHEEQEAVRIKLCKMEGDDGMPPITFEGEAQPHVYFMDASALARYANSLYICYLTQRFDPQSMKLEEEAIIYTTAKELDKLHEAETLENVDGAPFPDYTAYIRNYLILVPDVPLETLSCKRDGGMEDTPTTDDEKNVALALELQKRENLDVIMISESEEVHELAEFNGIAVKKPFDIVY